MSSMIDTPALAKLDVFSFRRWNRETINLILTLTWSELPGSLPGSQVIRLRVLSPASFHATTSRAVFDCMSGGTQKPQMDADKRRYGRKITGSSRFDLCPSAFTCGYFSVLPHEIRSGYTSTLAWILRSLHRSNDTATLDPVGKPLTRGSASFSIPGSSFASLRCAADARPLANHALIVKRYVELLASNP